MDVRSIEYMDGPCLKQDYNFTETLGKLWEFQKGDYWYKTKW